MKKLNYLLMFLMGFFIALQSMENPEQQEIFKKQEAEFNTLPQDVVNLILSFTIDQPEEVKKSIRNLTIGDLLTAQRKFLALKNVKTVWWKEISDSAVLNGMVIKQFKKAFPGIASLYSDVINDLFFAQLLGTPGALAWIKQKNKGISDKELAKNLLENIGQVQLSAIQFGRFYQDEKERKKYLNNIKKLFSQLISTAASWVDPNEYDLRTLKSILRGNWAILGKEFIEKLTPENKKKYDEN